MNMQKILARVQKMLNLANCEGATEGERDNALRMAHKTLAKHNLEMADLDEVERERMAGEKRTEEEMTFYGRPWARNVCSSVGKLFFCSYLYVSAKKTTQTRHSFIGRRGNAVTAGLLSMFIVKSIMREGKRRQKGLGQGNAWLRSFCWGAARSIQERVRAIKKAADRAQTDRGTGTALVLANVYRAELVANQQYLAIHYPELGTGRGGLGADRPDAYGDGVAYGKTVSLDQQIEN